MVLTVVARATAVAMAAARAMVMVMVAAAAAAMATAAVMAGVNGNDDSCRDGGGEGVESAQLWHGHCH